MRAERVETWMRPSLRSLKPYYKAPLEGNPLRLDQNTNLYGQNPVVATITAPQMDVYPTRDADDLLAALADFHGLDSENFIVGNGSDELIDIVTKTFTKPGDRLVCPVPSYSLYPFYAQLQDLQLKQIPLTSKFELDVDRIIEGEGMVIIANPNNPTGNCFAAEDLAEVIEKTNYPVVIDEAYIEYAGLSKSWMQSIDEYDNLLVMRTLSKAYGLAGLRVGYVAGNKDLIAKLRLVKPPFNLNTYSEKVAVAAIENQEWVDDVVSQTATEKERLQAKLKGLGFRVHDSDANFLLCEHETNPVLMKEELRQRKILVRTFTTAGLENKIRFGIGKPEHTDALVAALEDILRG